MAAITKYHRQESFNNRNVVLKALEGRNPRSRCWQIWFSGESSHSLPGFQKAAFLLCLFVMGEREGEGEGEGKGGRERERQRQEAYKDTNPSMRASPS